MLRQIFRAAVADGDGGVFLKQQQRHGLADDIAAADDHGVLARDRHARRLEHMQRSLGRTGDHAVLATGQTAHIHRMEAVHILFRTDQRQRPMLVQMSGQGKLYQNAVNGFVLIGPFNSGFQLRLRGFRPHPKGLGVDPQPGAGLFLVGYIGLAGRIVSHQNHAQAGHDVFLPKRVHLLFQFFFYLQRHCRAVQNFSRHCPSLPVCKS